VNNRCFIKIVRDIDRRFLSLLEAQDRRRSVRRKTHHVFRYRIGHDAVVETGKRKCVIRSGCVTCRYTANSESRGGSDAPEQELSPRKIEHENLIENGRVRPHSTRHARIAQVLN
jgi:hypothetical protein